ncbi:MAG: hypothetical protein ACTS6G_02205 [Candidatus Hodgkinia cicadicola]
MLALRSSDVPILLYFGRRVHRFNNAKWGSQRWTLIRLTEAASAANSSVETTLCAASQSVEATHLAGWNVCRYNSKQRGRINA